MENISLRKMFEESKDSLHNQLRGKMLPRDYQQIQNVVKDTFVKFLATDNEFRINLIDADVQLLNSIIRMYSSFCDASINDSIDYAKLSKTTEKEISVPEESSKENISKDFAYLIPTLVSAFIRPWLTIPVAVATVGVKYASSRRLSTRRVKVVEKEVEISQPISEELISSIIGALDKLCGEIDDIINSARRNREEIKNHYEGLLRERTLDKMYPQLLSSLRYVWKENKEKSQNEGKAVESLISDFENYGYKVVELTPENRSCFSFTDNPRVEKEIMYLPAVVRINENGETEDIVENGIVHVPKQYYGTNNKSNKVYRRN